VTSDPAAGRLSTYAFPEELRVDELLLREPRDTDIDVVAPAFLDPAIGGEAGLPPVGAAELRVMLRDLLPGMRAHGLLAPYVIEDVRSGAILGGATLHHFDPMRDAVEVGYWLFVEARGRGVATRSVQAMAEHAFANGIYRVEAHVRVGNEASERVLERAGFAREGVKRRYLRRQDDTRHDATLFARLADDA
jgi:RimJ/RimL family protein N-acetyltransferase